MKVSDILTGNFAPLEIPMIDIDGTKPLIYNEPDALRAEIAEKDLFMPDEAEEEFLMFPAEIIDFWGRAKDGPHQTLRWRKKVRNFGVEIKAEHKFEEVAEDQEQPPDLADENVDAVSNECEFVFNEPEMLDVPQTA